jgi:hypothetical protein
VSSVFDLLAAVLSFSSTTLSGCPTLFAQRSLSFAKTPTALKRLTFHDSMPETSDCASNDFAPDLFDHKRSQVTFRPRVAKPSYATQISSRSELLESQMPVRDSHPMLPKTLLHALFTLHHLCLDFIHFFCNLLKPRFALAVENLFLRKQLALYQERLVRQSVRPQRATDATRLTLVLLGKFFEWKEALTVARTETFIGWHRKGYKLFWRWESRSIGRPKIPKDLRQLILSMANDNPSWGQARIAAALLVKLGIQVSPRTIQKYLLQDPGGSQRRPVPSQRWMTFAGNHAQAMLACDFFVSVISRFRVLYVFVIMEVGTRRVVHFNVTDNIRRRVDLTAVSRGYLLRTCLSISDS